MKSINLKIDKGVQYALTQFLAIISLRNKIEHASQQTDIIA